MKFSDVLKFLKPAASIAASFIPGGAAAVELVNAFLPEEKQLPPTATGGEVIDAYEGLTPEQQTSLREKEIDLEIAKEEGWTDRFKVMVEGDKQSTRPKIAWSMCQLLCFEIMAFTVWCFVYPTSMKSAMTWTVFATLTATPAGLLGKYFGELRKEQANRLNAPTPSILKNVIDQFKR